MSLLADTLNFPMPHVMGIRPQIDAGDAFRAPFRSDIPALFISATLDGRTYPDEAAEGDLPEDLPALVAHCRKLPGLELKGLMCIPPSEEAPAPYFALMRKHAKEFDLPWLSMGMSGDFETAIAFGATHVRVGTALFGDRKIS